MHSVCSHRYAVAGKEKDWEQALGTSEATPGIVSIPRKRRRKTQPEEERKKKKQKKSNS